MADKKKHEVKRNFNREYVKPKPLESGKVLMEKYEKILDFKVFDDNLLREPQYNNENSLQISPLIKRDDHVSKTFIPSSLLNESTMIKEISETGKKHRKYNSLPKLSIQMRHEGINNNAGSSSILSIQKPGISVKRPENETERLHGSGNKISKFEAHLSPSKSDQLKNEALFKRTQDIKLLMQNTNKVEKSRFSQNNFDISYLNESLLGSGNFKANDNRKDFSVILSEEFSKRNIENSGDSKNNFLMKAYDVSNTTPFYEKDLNKIKSKLNFDPLTSNGNKLRSLKILDKKLLELSNNIFAPTNKAVFPDGIESLRQTLNETGMFRKSQNKLNMNALASKPSNRQEVTALEEWLNQLELEIKMKEGTYADMLFDLQIIYSAAMREIIRQVTVHCNERGRILERIWLSYISLIEDALLERNFEKESSEMENNMMINRVHMIYEKKLSMTEKDHADLKKKSDDQESNMKILLRDNQYLKKLYKINQQEIKSLTTKFSDLTEENSKLVKKLIEERERNSNVYGNSNDNSNGYEEKNNLSIDRYDKVLAPRRAKNMMSSFDDLTQKNKKEPDSASFASSDKRLPSEKKEEKVGEEKSRALEYLKTFDDIVLADKYVNTDSGYNLRSANMQLTRAVQTTETFMYKPAMVDSSVNTEMQKLLEKQIQVNEMDILMDEKVSLEDFPSSLNEDEVETIRFIARNVESMTNAQPAEFEEYAKKFMKIAKEEKNLLKLNAKMMKRTLEISREIYLQKRNGLQVKIDLQDTKLELEDLRQKYDYVVSNNEKLEKKCDLVSDKMGFYVMENKELKEELKKLLKTQNVSGKEEFKQTLRRIESRSYDKIMNIYLARSLSKVISESENPDMMKENGEQNQMSAEEIKQGGETNQVNEEQDGAMVNQAAIKANPRAQDLESINYKRDSVKGILKNTTGDTQEESPKKIAHKTTFYEKGKEILEKEEEPADIKTTIMQTVRASLKNNFSLSENLKENGFAIDVDEKDSSEGHDSFSGDERLESIDDLNRITSMNNISFKELNNKVYRQSKKYNKEVLGKVMNTHKSNRESQEAVMDPESAIQKLKFKTPGNTLKTALPFSKKERVARVFSVNTEQANNLLNEVKEKKHTNNIRPISIGAVLKFVSHVYLEYMEKRKDGKFLSIPLHVLCYEHILNQFGFRKIAEQKLKQLYWSCVCYKGKNLRLDFFSRFLGLYSALDLLDLQLALDMMIFFEEGQPPLSVAGDPKEKVLVPAERCFEFIFAHKKYILGHQELEKLKEDVHNKKTFDQKKVALIEFEDFFADLLKYKQITKKRNMEILNDLYTAADLDNDGMIEFYEFELLFINVEKDRYEEKEVKKIFFSSADLIVPISEEKALSQEKFMELVLELNLFSKDKIILFASTLFENDKVVNFNSLRENWNERKNIIKIRLVESGNYKTHLKKILEGIDKLITDENHSETVLWISYRLLEEESRRVHLDHVTKGLIDEDLLKISNSFVKLISDEEYL